MERSVPYPLFNLLQNLLSKKLLAFPISQRMPILASISGVLTSRDPSLISMETSFLSPIADCVPLRKLTKSPAIFQ